MDELINSIMNHQAATGHLKNVARKYLNSQLFEQSSNINASFPSARFAKVRNHYPLSQVASKLVQVGETILQHPPTHHLDHNARLQVALFIAPLNINPVCCNYSLKKLEPSNGKESAKDIHMM